MALHLFAKDAAVVELLGPGLHKPEAAINRQQFRPETENGNVHSLASQAAQVVLGHSMADVTQIYAERDLSQAERIMKEVG